MTSKTYFWGVYEGSTDDGWAALHEYFEKLAREDDDAATETTITDRKAVNKKEGNRD